jgi:hypothetical protein
MLGIGDGRSVQIWSDPWIPPGTTRMTRSSQASTSFNGLVILLIR